MFAMMMCCFAIAILMFCVLVLLMIIICGLRVLVLLLISVIGNHRPLLSLSYLAYKYLPKQRKYSYFKYIQIFNFSVTSTEELNFGYSTEGS
jgi:hypothetical protein